MQDQLDILEVAQRGVGDAGGFPRDVRIGDDADTMSRGHFFTNSSEENQPTKRETTSKRTLSHG